MVRVISVHHFVSQDIHTCEDPVAVTTAPPDFLLLALPQHVVEVRDLAKGGDVIFNFPTVDQVHQMIHCCNGNYVATLELKQSRQGKECTHARIYANWDAPSAVQQGTGANVVQQPMRARIAGRVTPSSAQSGPPSLEMIELPLKRTPNIIACCQATGNLLVASHKTVMLYHFHVRTHDISRLRFIDFEESGVCVELSFNPSWMSVAEDIVACMSQEHVHVFRLGAGGPDGWNSERKCLENKKEHKSGLKSTTTDSHIDWDEILKDELKSRSNGQLHHYSFPLTVTLPSIATERANSSSNSPSGMLQRQSPFQIAPPDMTIMVRCASPASTPWAAKNEVLHLLQLQLTSTPIGSSTRQVYSPSCEEFRCLILKPVYVKTEKSNSSDRKANPMHSSYYGGLVSVMCLVVTQQEGYLYHFEMEDLKDRSKLQQAACVTVYPFTAPVSSIVMERFLLHALTETGLETYTLKAGHHLVAALDPVNNITSACPPVDDPVCLVGLRPFLGVEHILVANNHLVLLACSEGSSSSSQDSSHCGGSWTLYSLSLPSPGALYADILSVGSAHRWSSPTTYCHLLCEGHIILRTALATLIWQSGTSEAVLTTYDQKDVKKLEDLYRDSCALLADYYITCEVEEEWRMASPYYRMAGLTPMQVVERVRKIEIPPEVTLGRMDKDSKGNLQGLMSYLHTCLLQLNQAPGDMLFNPAVPSFAHTLLDLFEELDPAQVSTLVLHSSLLREYATDRVLGIMKKQLSVRAVPEAADALALVLLCIQRGSPEQAIAVLDSLSSDSLTKILLENPTLLLEQHLSVPNAQTPSTQDNKGSSLNPSHKTEESQRHSPNRKVSPTRGRENVPSFSELATVLMDSKPAVLADVLADLVIVSEFATLQLILQVFLEYIPSRIGIAGSTASHVLQMFLEKYFTWFFKELPSAESTSSYDLATVEALKILVRSYLSDLQRYNMNISAKKNSKNLECNKSESKEKNEKIGTKWEKDSNTNVLFQDSRLAFLGKMPPFAADLPKRLLSLQEGVENLKPVQNIISTNNDSLFKLQCLLCSDKLPKECLIEVHQFVHTHPEVHGNLSLQVLCVPTREATNILLDFCPQALLQYTKDKFSTEMEWKYLLLLLHRKVQALGDESVLKPFYLQVTKDILTHLAQTLSLEDLCKVLPPGGENMYRSYVQICQQVGHANHIRALMMATGQQLLSTLNL